MGEKKIPLLQLLCQKFRNNSKKELFAKILCGEVYVNNEKVCDRKRLINPSANIELKYKEYVSRGGIKLAHVIRKWDIEVQGKVFIDAGCSTGGFTDCLIKHGAGLVYAVDVGYNQLAYSLRMDNRVILYERTNIMSMHTDSLNPRPHAGVCDLSFRSISGAANHILDLVASDMLIGLVKPQFEWEYPEQGFNGVIHDNHIILSICEKLLQKLSTNGVFVSRVTLSPITGTKGNTELFFLLQKNVVKKKGDILASIASLLHI